jgi:hypothetical protein
MSGTMADLEHIVTVSNRPSLDGETNHEVPTHLQPLNIRPTPNFTVYKVVKAPSFALLYTTHMP